MTSEWSPYPGLRPFQPDDSEYFYGRDRQVDEIVERLRSKRFVAVIGGSGSGKSSLVLAGAIPRLRSFAIKDAGDFWAPVIATPGTNHVDIDTPIRRLARKFCGELAELAEAEDAAARLEACVELLRRPNGLGELVERFGGQLKGSDHVSLDRLQVNFLFLIDQFEELFHPSNVREPIATDCRHLVDRIVEQFKQPHRQICIAITMRSEHLNDCPRYEALPDAINAASYLVKRLDTVQLADAIEQPVLRYLRKHVAAERAARRQGRLEGRGMAPIAPVPDDIPIDAALIARLVADSNAVLAQQDHADHLPLLQHLLFWIWHEASERPDNVAMVDDVSLDDLWRAVGATPGTVPGAALQPLAASVNTLQACLENRCEAIFASQVGEQAAWQAVFRSLAFKEPNTGSYTQQRAAMADLRARLGMDAGGAVGGVNGADGDEGGADDGANQALAAHLRPWLAPHGYLHWDADSRTVKVAHETLIRRWQRLRHWIDEEDLQFHVYLRLLEDCESWVRAPIPDDALSGGETLRRYEDAQLPAVLQDAAWLGRIARLLAMDRDGARLSAVAGQALPFLQRSIDIRCEKEQKRRKDEERQRFDEAQLAEARRNNDLIAATNAALQARAETALARSAALESGIAAEKEKSGRLRWLWLAVVLFVIMLPLMAWVWELAHAETLLAEKERTLQRSYALAAESQVDFQPQFKDVAGPQGLLRYSLIGARFFEQGWQLTDGPARSWWLRDYYHERLDALRNTERFSESRNISSLRTILQGAVWAAPAAVSAANADVDAAAAAAPAELPCKAMRLESGGAELLGRTGSFYPRSGATDGRGLVVTVAPADPSNPFPIKSISVGQIGGEGHCLVGRQLLATPQQQHARVGVASDASNVVVAFDDFTQFYTVMWDDPAGVYTRPRATVSSRSTFDDGSLPTWRGTFWADVALGGSRVRLFDVEPSVIGDALAVGGQALTRLATPSAAATATAKGHAASACASLIDPTHADAGTDEIWAVASTSTSTSTAPGKSRGNRDTRSHCLRITTLTTHLAKPIYLASLYALGQGAAAEEVRSKDVPLINQLSLGEDKPTELRLDERAGWLAVRSSQGGSWRAVPWSLNAFGGLARDVFKPAGAEAGTLAEHGCARANEDPQFHRPYNLILGLLKCPEDGVLKQSATSVR